MLSVAIRPLSVSHMSIRSEVKSQMHDHQLIVKYIKTRTIMSPGVVLPGLHTGARPGFGAHRQASGDRLGLKMVMWVCLPVGSPPKERFMRNCDVALQCSSHGWGIDSDTWRGMVVRNSLPNLNLSGVLLLDFCDIHSFPITNTMFKHKDIPQCT